MMEIISTTSARTPAIKAVRAPLIRVRFAMPGRIVFQIQEINC
jgi:hypothetical protein